MKIVLVWHYHTCGCSCYALFDNMSYVQRKVWDFVHSVEFYWRNTIFLAGSDVLSRRRRCWKWLFSLFSTFATDLKNTHPRAEGDELEHALKGEAHGEGEVHVGEEVPQHERRSVKLNTGKDKTRMKKGLKCVRNYCCFSWAVDIDRKAIEFDKLTCGPISRPRLLDSWCKKAILALFWGIIFETFLRNYFWNFSEDNFSETERGVLSILNFNSQVLRWQSINIRREKLNSKISKQAFSVHSNAWGV